MQNDGPFRENICAVIITYNPPGNFLDRLKEVRLQLGKVVIVDNKSDPNFLTVLNELEHEPDIFVIKNGKNLGIAYALNRGIKWAIENGYRWALTLDHDTDIEKNMIDTLSHLFTTLPYPEKVGILSANYLKVGNNCKNQLGNNQVTSDHWFEQRVVITSGSILSLKVYQEIGPFREDFFIDAVDHEYCLRCRKCGYKIIFYKYPLMHHRLGNISSIPNPLLPKKSFYLENYSPQRRYFIFRNTFITFFEYVCFDPIWNIKEIIQIFKRFFIAICLEKDKMQNLKYMLFGIFDGFTKNMKRNPYHSQD